MTRTPHGRDLVGPFVEACRAEGLKVGFYHSLIDWHHPSFPVDGTHPHRDDEEFKASAADRDIRDYQRHLHGQVRELLTDYGRIDYLFFDFSYAGRGEWWGGKGPDDWDSPGSSPWSASSSRTSWSTTGPGCPGTSSLPSSTSPPPR